MTVPPSRLFRICAWLLLIAGVAALTLYLVFQSSLVSFRNFAGCDDLLSESEFGFLFDDNAAGLEDFFDLDPADSLPVDPDFAATAYSTAGATLLLESLPACPDQYYLNVNATLDTEAYYRERLEGAEFPFAVR